MARDKLPKRIKTNPKHTHFINLVNKCLREKPDEPLPKLAVIAKIVGAPLATIRSWAKVDFSDLYGKADGWITTNEIFNEIMKESEKEERPPTGAIDILSRLPAPSDILDEDGLPPW